MEDQKATCWVNSLFLSTSCGEDPNPPRRSCITYSTTFRKKRMKIRSTSVHIMGHEGSLAPDGRLGDVCRRQGNETLPLVQS